MSDNISDISKAYHRHGLSRHSWNIGLFPIPETPESEDAPDRGMWSSTLDTILTTLRYLAPSTLLALFWSEDSLIFRILRHIDFAIKSITYSNNDQRDSVLKWLEEAGDVKVEHLGTVWRHGWIICGVLEAAIPGTCAGHAPTRLSLKHAQTIADHYLGVAPVFSHQELESYDLLSRRQELKLIQYLDSIRQALSKLTPPVSLPSSQRTSPDSHHFTLDYISRGSGLSAAQINRKTYFKIYPTSQQSMDPGEITILIRGPKDTYGMTVTPPLLGKAQTIRQNLLGLQPKTGFTETVLPLTQGVTYLRSYGRNDMNKTFYIPKERYDIDIQTEIRSDYVRVGYIVPLEGTYQISITSRGDNILGSPYTVTCSHHIVDILQKDSFCLEDGEEIDILDVNTDRKVVLRIVDFVTEKMLLKENGSLEKISEDEARLLMYTGKEENNNIQNTCSDTITKKHNFDKFKHIILRVNTMLKICNVFKRNLLQRTLKPPKKDILDVVNSTLSDNLKQMAPIINEIKKVKPSTKADKRKSTNTEKSNTLLINQRDHNLPVTHNEADNSSMVLITACENENITENHIKLKHHNNSNCDRLHPSLNYDLQKLERPKSPIFEYLSDDKKYPKIEKQGSNEFLNPFFMHNHRGCFETTENLNDYSATNFIIGAPVLLPPIIGPISPEPDMDSIILASNLDEALHKYEIKLKSKQSEHTNDDVLPMEISIQDQICCKGNANNLRANENISLSICTDNSKFYSLDSHLADEFHNNNINQQGTREFERISKEHESSSNDTWDSAYVSIDEIPTSLDTSNESVNETTNKHIFSLSDSFKPRDEELVTLGPAEQEIWKNMHLRTDNAQVNKEKKITKFECNRPLFTPIIEEPDSSCSASLKNITWPVDSNKNKDVDSVTMAFAELNDIFQEYSNSEDSSLTNLSLPDQTEVECITDQKIAIVESASEYHSDVIRRQIPNNEGTISEVQVNVTESSSVSQVLQTINDGAGKLQSKPKLKNQTKFGEQYKNNIVLERKKYWDEKIRITEEMKLQQHKRKKITSKPLKQDSLTRRRGKQIFHNIVKVGESKNKESIISTKDSEINHDEQTLLQNDKNIVEKWKKYWNEKLKDEMSNCNQELKSEKFKDKNGNSSAEKTILYDVTTIESPKILHAVISTLSPAKSLYVKESVQVSKKNDFTEEVFRAFETSPKRFFGTSRKQILNKIDTFLGKNNYSVKESPSTENTSQENGIVSSRVSLFHNILQTENIPKINEDIQAAFIPDNLENINKQKTNSSKDILGNGHIPLSINKDFVSFKLEPKDALLNANTQEVEANNVNVQLRSVNSKFHQKTELTKLSEINTPVNKLENDKTVSQSLTKQYRQSISKSEMDIFNKVAYKDKTSYTEVDRHKSCEELPKINVKGVISIYESVTKNASIENEFVCKRGKIKRNQSLDYKKRYQNYPNSGEKGSVKELNGIIKKSDTLKYGDESNDLICKTLKPDNPPKSVTYVEDLINSSDKIQYFVKKKNSNNSESMLIDIEVEIIDKSVNRQQTETKVSNNENEVLSVDYKSRFKLAKEYFQSLEEVIPDRNNKTRDCELNSCNNLKESHLETKNVIKNKKDKSHLHSFPDCSTANERNDNKDETGEKLVKISEKFNVEDLFNDVVSEGRLSRQGSFKGIPHKKAVLETFKSMDNILDNKLSSYEITASQLSEFAKENNIKNVQTYLTEYPYLPTTDPSKYHSRCDIKATGLISRSELLNNKPRRNSVPDIRMNAKFITHL